MVILIVSARQNLFVPFYSKISGGFLHHMLFHTQGEEPAKQSDGHVSLKTNLFLGP